MRDRTVPLHRSTCISASPALAAGVIPARARSPIFLSMAVQRRGPIKCCRPEPCSSKQGLPLRFRPRRWERKSKQKSADNLLQSGYCVEAWVSCGVLLCEIASRAPGESVAGRPTLLNKRWVRWGTCARHRAAIDWRCTQLHDPSWCQSTSASIECRCTT